MTYQIIQATSGGLYVFWNLCWIAYMFPPLRGFFRGFVFELRPLIIPAALVVTISRVVHTHHDLTWSEWVTIICSVINYFNSGKDDDDRWKRRRKRLAEKVANVGGRLEVVPVSGDAR